MTRTTYKVRWTGETCQLVRVKGSPTMIGAVLEAERQVQCDFGGRRILASERERRLNALAQLKRRIPKG